MSFADNYWRWRWGDWCGNRQTIWCMRQETSTNETPSQVKWSFPLLFASFQQAADMEATERSQIPYQFSKLSHTWRKSVDWRCRHQCNLWALLSGMPYVTSCIIIHFHQELQRQQQEEVLFVQYPRFLSANGVHSPPQRSYSASSLSVCDCSRHSCGSDCAILSRKKFFSQKTIGSFPSTATGNKDYLLAVTILMLL